MKKIGLTSNGMVIVEMTPAEFEALEQPPKVRATPNQPFTMDYILPRLLKSKPGTRETIANFITAMFQFQGGVSVGDVDRMIVDMQKVGAFEISPTGDAAYK